MVLFKHQMDSIYNIIKKAEDNLVNGKPVKLGKYAEHDHTEKIATIDAYLNSQHISGKYDSLGREKPFFNIVTIAKNVWYKATDIDRKDIRFNPTSHKNRFKVFLASILLRSWMIKERFGIFLNLWGQVLAGYGSAVVKFSEKSGRLIPTVVAWDRLICDPIDFYSNPIVEKIYYTPDQLRGIEDYDQESVEEAIKACGEVRETLENEQVDSRADYIGIYELHGNLPLKYLTGKDNDAHIYRQQMHVVFIKRGGAKDKKDLEITLYSGKEKQNPYYLAHLIESDGRTLSIGAVESVFDPQWMVNHSALQIKNQLDLASKQFFQTADEQFAGRNLMTEADTGDLFIYDVNKGPISQLNNQSHDMPNVMANLNTWKDLSREITGAFESMTGEVMPSGTPYSLGALVFAQAKSLFDIMKQNKGLYLEDMLRKYVIPYFKKSLRNSDEIALLLEGEDLERFDELFLPANLQKELMANLMAGKMPTMEELNMMVEQENEQLGGMRFIVPSEADKNKTWADYFDDLDWNAIEVNITGEYEDKSSTLQTLNSLYQIMSAQQDPRAEKILEKIMDISGVLSPLELRAGVAPQQKVAGLPQSEEATVGTPAGRITTKPEELVKQ